MPDIFVPLDTNGKSHYLNELFYKGIFNQFSFDYSDKKRISFIGMGYDKFVSGFQISNELLKSFIDYADNNGVKKNDAQIKQSETLIKNYLKASIARNIWNDEGFYPIYNKDDKALLRAIDFLK